MLKRGLFAAVGLLSVALGVLGIFLPLLPTVPFILFALYCFARSSQRLHNWLLNHPWFREAIADWQQHKGLRKSIKKRALVLSALSFMVSIIIVPLLWVKGLLLIMATCLLTYLWRLPTLPER
ncbi:YbaN family protein [Parashewanella tropica]|uniref:YbaN family protein n=1 Tax=Parashewanella tropica TaxID=2547970 RepID=UPI00105AA30F|nr:YbaN family protein [Parashewanella tropica]